MSRIGIYPGTFDPITKGHLDIIERALNIVDKLIIAVAADVPKTPIFSIKKRIAMIKSDVKIDIMGHNIEVLPFNGLLIDFARKTGSSVIIRGLRAVSDYEYELQLASMNSKMAEEIETVFLPASEHTQFIASSLVKEVARLGGDVSQFVSEEVANNLKKYYSKKR